MTTAFCFDLDGTITREEILPKIAVAAGIQDEISALTMATIQGHIPFRKSFLLRCRLLDDVPISLVQSIVATMPMHDHVVSFIQSRPEQCFVITGNLDVWVDPLRTQLGCRFYASSARVQDDRLIGVEHVLDKYQAVGELRKRFSKIVAVGDGMGDVAMFEAAEVAIAFGGTHDPVQSLVENATHLTYDERTLCRLLSTQ